MFLIHIEYSLKLFLIFVHTTTVIYIFFMKSNYTSLVIPEQI